MAALFNYSCNNIVTASLPGAYASIFGSPTVGSGDGPQGINTIHCNGNTEGVYLPNVAININGNGLILGAGFDVTAFGSGGTGLYSIGSNLGLTAVISLVLGADGSLQIVSTSGSGNPTVLASSASGTFTFGNRHEVEFIISAFSSSGTATVNLDGVPVTNLITVAVSNLASLQDGATIHSVLAGCTNQEVSSGFAAESTPIVMDSTYAFDTSGSFCNAPVGPAISVPMIPNGVGQESSWAPNGAALGWECISEIPPDGDTTYISSDTPTQEEACALSAPVGISGVYCVSVIGDQRQDTSGGGRTIELGLGNGTTRSYVGAWGLGTTYKMNTTPFSENPFTSSAWTLGAMTGLQVAALLAS